MSVSDQLAFINTHWREPIPVPKFRRNVFQKIVDLLTQHQIITLIGPRRVGKTTLLKQLIHYLMTDKQILPSHIIFFQFDVYRSDLITLLNSYQSLTGIDYRKTKFYLILDEIQYLHQWASHVKLIWDTIPNLQIILSGSSSSELLQGRESLAGREIMIKVNPLSFQEYCQLTNKQVNLPHIRWETYLMYMDHQLPELALHPLNSSSNIQQLVDKVIHYDLKRLYNLADTHTIYRIFRIICKDPGQIIKYHDLAQEFAIDPQTVRNYLGYLEDSMLIRKVYNYTKNARKSERSHRRYYPFFTSLIRFANPNLPEFGKKAETEVAFQLNAEYFWNDRTREIDFILITAPITGLEVKMRTSIHPKDVKTLIQSELVKKKIIIHSFKSNLSVQLKDTKIQFYSLDQLEFLKENISNLSDN